MEMLSENFSASELDVEDAEDRIVASAKFLCVEILEPLRAEVGPLVVHCGFREPDHNQEVGGAADSYHLYTGDRCAADVVPASGLMQDAFNWLRLHSDLPFHKVILEHDKLAAPRCIHIQAHADAANRTAIREAFTGLIAGESKTYLPVPCIAC